MQTDYRAVSRDLVDLLGLSVPPIAIAFSASAPDGIERFDRPMPPPTADGRTGRVPAGRVFWVLATERSFVTVPEDHGNCSVGSLTHGLHSLADAATKADVAALVEAGWVSPEMFPGIPTVKHRPDYIVYGPLAEARGDPDVVFIRLNGKQVMMLHAAWPALRFEGKPQCHIIPIAKEAGEVAVSVGCMLSRVRTGISNNEVTCAIPWAALPDLLDKLRQSTAADKHVARYAAEDSHRFAQANSGAGAE
jgi:uncharacterized protein (DUF169 family)